ncbi:MAG: hydroxyacid dehydrogenase [Thermomicrobiales bacterium]
MTTPRPLVYVAVAPERIAELDLGDELPRLDAEARIEYWPGPGNTPPEAVADALERAEVVITSWGTPRLAALTEWTPETFPVRLIAHSAGTVKQLVPLEAVERGLKVTHANDSLAEAVAEFTIGVMIVSRRQFVQAVNRMKGRQPRVAMDRQHELTGSTVGIIGASNIGRRVMRLLAPWRVSILLADPYCTPEVAAEYGATLVPLHDVMAQSDIVSLHAPVTPETMKMLGAAEFGAMKDGALFINTARGRLIDADALLRELQTGRIDAFLDVTDPTEPLPADSPFFALDNCVVAPHMAAVTVEARQRQSRYTVDEVLRFLRGETLQHEVTAARWPTMA